MQVLESLQSIKVCRKCGVELVVGKNWYESLVKYHNYTCITCYKTYINGNHRNHGYAAQKKWTRNHQKEVLVYRQQPRVKAQRNRNSVRARLKIKMRVIKHYSSGTFACANLYHQHKQPYCDIRALTIDHIAGNGAEHKREIGLLYGRRFYEWLIRNNFPPGFQVLCANCQFIKRVVNKEW